jgi:hypothetical protein
VFYSAGQATVIITIITIIAVQVVVWSNETPWGERSDEATWRQDRRLHRIVAADHCHHVAVVVRPARLEKTNASLFSSQLFRCLSRACLGKEMMLYFRLYGNGTIAKRGALFSAPRSLASLRLAHPTATII